MSSPARIVVAAMLLTGTLVACDGPPDRTPTIDSESAKRGKLLFVEAGCASCHRVSDVAWPQGGLGPSLDDFANQSLIAGTLANRPGNLMNFVRNAPEYIPGGAMPAIDLSDKEARDVAAYLLTLRPE